MKYLKLFESQSDIDIIKDILAYISDDFIVEVVYIDNDDFYNISIYKHEFRDLGPDDDETRDFIEFQITPEVIDGIKELKSQLNCDIEITYCNSNGYRLYPSDFLLRKSESSTFTMKNMLGVGEEVGEIILYLKLNDIH